jgi:hypothetical protein
MENELFTREGFLALLHHSVLHSESPAEEEDDLEDSEDDAEDSEEDMEIMSEEPEYYIVTDYSYLSSLLNLSTIGAYAYDAAQEVNAMDADASLSYEQRTQAVAAISKQYRMDTIPYIVELIEHVFEMVDNVDEQAAALFEEISLLHLLTPYYQMHGTDSRGAVTRAIFVKQLIDAYVLTR